VQRYDFALENLNVILFAIIDNDIFVRVQEFTMMV